MMNDEQLDALIDAHLNGVLDDAGRRALEERLLHSAAARARFWELADTHILVHEGLQQRLSAWGEERATEPAPTGAGSTPRNPPTRWLQYRLLTAAAAGLAIGVFCASAAWAYVSPALPKLVKHVLAVANPGFEDAIDPIPDGIGVRFGVWSGDYSELVAAQQGIRPREGSRMFRFLRSDSTKAVSRGPIFNGNIYQVVDVKQYRDAIAGGTAVVDWSAWFNRVPDTSVKETRFVASVWAFAGDTAILPNNWTDKLYQEIGYSSSNTVADDSPGTWQRIAGSMLVPPETDFLVVELKVVPAEPRPVNGVVTFEGHYADDVQLVLRTNAVPPLIASRSGRETPTSGSSRGTP